MARPQFPVIFLGTIIAVAYLYGAAIIIHLR
jgi:hypothetical protein